MLKKLLCVVAMLIAHAAHGAVDANKADQEALESVRGIGPAVSQRILDERKKAPFKSWGDFIGRVRGVGDVTAKRFSREGLTVNGAMYAPGERADKAHRTSSRSRRTTGKADG